jgi:hypothetical protein
MIIHFEFSPSELAGLSVDLLREVCSELLRAYRRGYHVVVIERATAAWLLENVVLTAQEKATLNKISAEYTQSGDLIRRCSTYIKVGSFAQGTIRRVGRAFEISPDEIIRPHLLDRVAFVVEDIVNDGGLYEFIANSLRDKFYAPPAVWETVHGGGERICDVAADKIRAHRIVVVVVDSDRNAPTDKCEKMEKLAELGSGEAWPLCFFLSPPCREAENLFSSIIIAQIPSAKEAQRSLEVLITVAAAEETAGMLGHEVLWLYFDLKEGWSAERLKNFRADAQGWILSRLRLSAGLDEESFMLSGFGRNIIHQVMSSNAISAMLRAEIRTRAWLDLFGTFFTDLTWVCAGGRPQFT